jgi:hypothetical protein
VVSITVVDPVTNMWMLVRRGTTNALVSWPVTCSGWTLELATNPVPGALSWEVVPEVPVATTNGMWQVGLPAPHRVDLFRLTR